MYYLGLGIKLVQRSLLFSITLSTIFSAFCAAALFLIYPYWAAFVSEPVENYRNIAYFSSKSGLSYEQQKFYLAKQASFSSISRLLPDQLTLNNGTDINILRVDPEFFTVFQRESADFGKIFESNDDRELARTHIIINDRLIDELRSLDSLSEKKSDVFIEAKESLYKVVGVVNAFGFPVNSSAWALIAERDLRLNRKINVSFVGVLRSGQSFESAQREFEQIMASHESSENVVASDFRKLSDFSRIGFDIDLTVIAALLVCLLISGVASVVGSLLAHLLKMDKGWKVRHLVGVQPYKIIAEPIIFILLLLLFGAVMSLFVFLAGYTSFEKYQIVKSELAPFWWNMTPTTMSNIKFVSIIVILTTALISTFLLIHLFKRYSSRFISKVGRNNIHWFDNFYWVLLGMQIVVSVWVVFFIITCVLAYFNEAVLSRGFAQENRIVLQMSKQTNIGKNEISQRVTSVLGLNEDNFSIINEVPGDNKFSSYSSFYMDDEASNRNPLAVLEVSTSFFKVLDIDITEGRQFNEYDYANSEPVIIVDRDTAMSFGGEREVLGRTITLYPHTEIFRKKYRVIGVAKNISSNTINLKTAYIPLGQGITEGKNMKIIIRGEGPSSYQEVASLVESNSGIFSEPYYFEEVIKKSGAPYLARIFNFIPSAVLMVLMLLLSIKTITSRMLQSKLKDIAVMLSVGCKRKTIILTVLQKYLVTVGCSYPIAYLLIFYSDATVWMIYASRVGNEANSIFLLIIFAFFMVQSFFIVAPIYRQIGMPVSVLLKNQS